MEHKTGYQPLGAGYSYAALRNGVSLALPTGKEIYCSGQAEVELRRILELLDDIAIAYEDNDRAEAAKFMLGEFIARHDYAPHRAAGG